jgi:hypothetical protein
MLPLPLLAAPRWRARRSIFWPGSRGALTAFVVGRRRPTPALPTARSTPKWRWPRGLCRQRNRALELLAGRCDVVIFFDDDFVPSPDYLAA